MSKLFSVVVPVYNGEAYIQDTLDSLAKQTYQHFELIVVDGGSTDKTLEILGRNKDLIDILISEKDEGMYDALRKGFDRSSGEYLCYINADDRLLPYALEKAVQKFSEDNYDIVFGDVNYISETGDVIFMYKAINMGYKGIRSIRRLPFAQQSAFWTRKIYFEKGGFDKSLKYVADSKFFLSVCIDPAVKKGYIPFPMGEFRLHGVSFSVSLKDKMKLEHDKMVEELGLKETLIPRLAYEFMTKVININGIYKKKTYKGAKF